jgi:dephospho-CoA kinase
VDRQGLGAQVFGNPAALAQLEQIVHPAVATERATFLIENRGAAMAVFDIPLLYEKGHGEGLDAVAVVTAPASMQRERVLARPGMTPEKFAQILSLQVPDADKRTRADFIIDTGVTLGETRAQVAALVQTIREKKRR